MPILDDIADAISALTDPRQHSEPRYTWDANRHRKPLPPHITTVPGLIQQLRDLAEPGVDGEAGGGAGGRESVPVAVDAVSLLGSIEYGAARRLADEIERGAREEPRTGAEDCLRALVGLAPRMPHSRTRVDPYLCTGCLTRTARDGNPGRRDLEHWLPCHHCTPTTQTELLREVRSWQWQADIIAGWRTPPRMLPAPCPLPDCGAKGTLLAYADPDNPRARCTGCGAQWASDPGDGEGQITVLAAHVTAYAGRSREQRDLARAEAVAARRRRDGEPVHDTPRSEFVAAT